MFALVFAKVILEIVIVSYTGYGAHTFSGII